MTVLRFKRKVAGSSVVEPFVSLTGNPENGNYLDYYMYPKDEKPQPGDTSETTVVPLVPIRKESPV